MRKLILLVTLFASACAPVLLPPARVYRPRYYAPRPRVMVVPAPHVRVWW